MSRFNSLLANTNLFVKNLRPRLCLDFGSSQTRVLVNGKIVWQQPTLLAWHTYQQSVIAVGDQASSLRGKIPDHVKLVAPIKQGIIVDLDAAEYYLKSILAQLKQENFLNPWLPVSCRLSVPAYSSPLELSQFSSSISQAGMKVEKLVSKTKAIVAIKELSKINQIHGLIDLGSQTIEVGVFSGHELIKAVTLTKASGDDFTRALQEQLLVEYKLEVGWAMAERIKHQLGSIGSLPASKTAMMTVRGKHAQSHLVTAVRVKAASFQESFSRLANIFAGELKEVINDLPAEVVTQLQEQGFYLTGGGSQLQGWQIFLQEIFEMPFITSKSAQVDLVRGLSSAK